MLNRVSLIGNVGKEPEVRNLESGSTFSKISIATAENWKDKAGQWQSKTEWHTVIFWGKLAEIAEKILNKGALVYLEGKITYRQWEDKDGNKRYSTEIVASSLKLLPKKEASTPPAAPVANQEAIPVGADDDLPF